MSYTRAFIAVFVALFLVGSSAMAQKIKNSGTIINTSTLSATNFDNFKAGAAGGKLHNNGAVTVSNDFTNGNGTENGEVHNQYSVTAGSMDISNNFANSGGLTYNSNTSSLIKIGGALSNTTAANFSTDSGKVEYQGTSTSVSATVKNATYGGLILSGAATKTLAASVDVNYQVDIGTGATFAVAANTLTLNGVSTPTVFGAGTGTFDAGSGTVIYNRNDDMNVRAGTYLNLQLADGGTKSATGNIVFNASGSLTNDGKFDLSTHTLDLSAGTPITISSNDTLRTQGSVSVGANTYTFPGLVLYENTTSQTVASANYADLQLAGGGGGAVFTMGSAVSVSGTYSVSGGTDDRVYSANTTNFTYNGTGLSQSIVGDDYYDLSLSGTDTSSYKNVSGALSTTNNLTIASTATLDMGGNSLSIGVTGSNSGQIRWATANTYVPGASGITTFYTGASGAIAAGASYGKIFLYSDASMSIAGAVTTNAAGDAFVVEPSAALAVSGTLTVTGGDLANDGTITNSGTVTVN